MVDKNLAPSRDGSPAASEHTAPTAKSLSAARKLRLFTWIPVLTYLRH